MTQTQPAPVQAPDKTEVKGSPDVKPEPKAKKLRRVLPVHMKVSDNIRWKVVVPVEWELADVQHQDAWVNVSQKLNRADIVDVFPDDLRWHAEMIVLAIQKNAHGAIAKLRVLRHTEFADKDFELDGGISSQYGVRWKGEMAQYGVFRKADGAWIRDGFMDEGAANAWLMGHIQAMKH